MDPERRLSERILFAFELALEQEDIDIATPLHAALELALTRRAGGFDFVERRDLSSNLLQALEKYKALRGEG